VPNEENRHNRPVAADFTLAQLDLLRIRSALTALMEKAELNDMSTQELRRIALWFG
jgi:hypothetical protein